MPDIHNPTAPVRTAHAGVRGFRADALYFDAQGQAQLQTDALLVVGPDPRGVAACEVVLALGAWADVAPMYPDVPVVHYPDRWLAPGFVDMHSHYPQLDVIGSPAPGLLPWLEQYTFPAEARFADAQWAGERAAFFVSELCRHGITTSLAFATSHVASVDALFGAAKARGMRVITGKCLQDQHSPDGVRDQTEQSLQDTESLIHRWHGVGRLGYAITPRFVPTSSAAQLAGAGELASQYPDVWVQSHVAENADEIAWVAQMFPSARSYLAVYNQFGLLRKRSVYAHCIHLDAADRDLMADTGAAAAICPTSNAFLGSGFFDFTASQRHAMAMGLASDVGGGTSMNVFRTMRAAYETARVGLALQGRAAATLSPGYLWWLHTAGAAQALDLEGVVGNLAVGCEADFVVINPSATPMLARKAQVCETLDEQLFAMIVLGDDRLIEHSHVALPTMPSSNQQTT
jgi:guanine deaminase